MDKRIVIVALGNRDSGKSTTWYEFFGRVIRTGYKRISFNFREIEIFVKNSSFEEMGEDINEDVFVRNASFEEYGDDAKEYFDINNLPKIVFCSVQYTQKGIETINFFKEHQYYIYIQWLNPGCCDSTSYIDHLKFEESFKDFGEFHIESGKEKKERVLKIKAFIYNWIRQKKQLALG